MNSKRMGNPPVPVIFFLVIICSLVIASCTPMGLGKTEPDVPYITTPPEVVAAMLRLAQVTKDDVVYDLGCGDGRIVIRAAKESGAMGVGVDIDPQLIKESIENARKENVTEKVRFIVQDLYETEIRDATVVTLFLLPGINEMLRPRFFKELRPGTRIVSHMHDMADWQPDKSIRVAGSTVYFWVIPADIDGSWRLSLSGSKEMPPYVLSVRQNFQQFTGSLGRSRHTLHLTGTRLEGRQIAFTVMGNEQGQKEIMDFTGQVAGSAMSGAVEVKGGPSPGIYSWTAERVSQ
jgi:SAM-dependent methyltransferase